MNRSIYDFSKAKIDRVPDCPFSLGLKTWNCQLPVQTAWIKGNFHSKLAVFCLIYYINSNYPSLMILIYRCFNPPFMICCNSICKVWMAREGSSLAERSRRWMESFPSVTAAMSSSSKKITLLVCSMIALQRKKQKQDKPDLSELAKAKQLNMPQEHFQPCFSLPFGHNYRQSHPKGNGSICCSSCTLTATHSRRLGNHCISSCCSKVASQRPWRILPWSRSYFQDNCVPDAQVPAKLGTAPLFSSSDTWIKNITTLTNL